MNGADLAYLLKDLRLFGGVLAADQLSHMTKGKLWIVNTSTAKEKGEHWVVYDTIHKYFFDSFAHAPRFYNLPSRGMKHSKKAVQHSDSVTCGIWCMYFVIYSIKGQSPARILAKFGRNKRSNDKYVIKWLSKYFAF